jgi:AraC-like DNA-binding protein
MTQGTTRTRSPSPGHAVAALSGVTGKGTKELITDRVMLEAARLLSFSDLRVNQVAFSTGFDDQLYFSRACKRHYGAPPRACAATERPKSPYIGEGPPYRDRGGCRDLGS